MEREIPKFLDEREEEEILKQPNKNAPTGFRNFMMMRLMLDCGLRISETIDLKMGNIKYHENRLEIRDAKGNKDRFVWINEDTLDDLDEWISWRGKLIEEGRIPEPEEKWVFLTFNGTQVKSSYMRRTVKKYAREGDVSECEKVSPHTLRHTFATNLYKNTNNMEIVKDALGHESSSTTEIYTHMGDEDLKNAMMNIHKDRGE